MPFPLDGILVLDLTHVLAGPFASTQLADFGAKVIKVERPGTGDDTRSFPPFVQGESGYFAALNHGKQSNRKSTRLNSSHIQKSRMPSSA